MPDESKQIHVIGIDTSSVESFFEAKKKQIFEAEIITGPQRILDSFKTWLKDKNIKNHKFEFIATDKLNDFIDLLKKGKKKTIVFSGGDPLWFGIGRLLIQNFPLSKLYFEPAATSFQLAFSRLGKPWQNTKWISLHGRDPLQFEKAIKKLPSSLVVLTDSNRGGAKEVYQLLDSLELQKKYEFWTFERLGYHNERILKISSINDFPMDLDPLHLVILFKKEEPKIQSKDLPLFGIVDSVFLQNADCPGLMTKKEVRVQILAELNLPKRGIIWDIGSGVGSIGLEALRISPNLKLVSIDKRVGSKNIIEENARRLGVKPSLIIEDEALNIFKQHKITPSLSSPERVIIGGGGSNSHLILEEVLKLINSTCIIIIPLISLKSISKLESILKPKAHKLSISQHQSYRGVNIGEDIRLSPLNPVFILKGEIK
ncbi:bifunctional cobalt-precorrin-7 (C(5))-methyltransferase/cobalt-precorrin-6B (C(15))-methyltransferase [Prochlorococcus marinus XMU1403]|uniref:precorrin-6y C5,15-methyltransferase (decarboxylating) subunit CbiE n=1 Tax=Prochlorococcus marinus TaxID=1219 RepID=UPI000D9113E2|nr:precorrin-6y C5,15-methyltransferase (decarboxylating) subunit CbiE [Prochlorococcus marinus]MBW3049887.1 bifunctional cobalt-precorrin-7 (C(5))-methyltransferase/cobalt-precorrin-6B (C(15))-methyltransferase [Prochlorococcus marinus str. MU1403]PYE00801.1 bifunctional cobalt-precorrin-7 (C(5))-methyltransferase/cobalt-precorrin-6B (C(15))-methyltransferase [Prochlorococcus marinus XMU1403]